MEIGQTMMTDDLQKNATNVTNTRSMYKNSMSVTPALIFNDQTK
jgi:hypothetical protein